MKKKSFFLIKKKMHQKLSPSKTHKNQKDYTTKKSSKDFDVHGHRLKKGERAPYHMSWNEFVAEHTKGKHYKNREAVSKNLARLAKEWRKLNQK